MWRDVLTAQTFPMHFTGFSENDIQPLSSDSRAVRLIIYLSVFSETQDQDVDPMFPTCL
jgi:hypothetical protein